MLPKISCVTVTNRPYLLNRAITYFNNQTYPNKELIILSHGIKTPNTIFCPKNMTLGAMRNLSIEIATGEIICQWDDDDLYHPFRLATQFKYLGEACAYRQHLKYYEETNTIYWIDWSIEVEPWQQLLPGTIMFWKSIFHQHQNILYPEDKDKEEDLEVVKKLQVTPIDEGHQYVYVYHGKNTYGKEHHDLVLKKKVLGKKELEIRKSLLTKTFLVLGLDPKVMTLEGEAWTH